MISAIHNSRKPSPAALPSALPALPVRRFTVDEYHRLLETGIVTAREPYELIHGWIIQKRGINPPHNFAVNALMELLIPLTGARATIRIQQPITTADSEPEPDLVVAAGSRKDYAKRNPSPEEVLILVEVADTSLEYDRTTKLSLYAGAKITEYWIVNLADGCVEVFTQPRTGKSPNYKKQTRFSASEEVPVKIGGKVGRIPVRELLVQGNSGDQ